MDVLNGIIFHENEVYVFNITKNQFLTKPACLYCTLFNINNYFATLI